MSFDTPCEFDFLPQESQSNTSSPHSISRSSTSIVPTPLFHDTMSLMSPLTRISRDPFYSRSGTPRPLDLPDFATVLAQPHHWELREFLAGGKAALIGPTGVALEECIAEICESIAEGDVESEDGELEVIEAYSTSLKRSNAIRRSRRRVSSSSESAASQTSEDSEEDLTPQTASSSIYSNSDVSNLDLNDPTNIAAADAAAGSVEGSGTPDSDFFAISYSSTVASTTPETDFVSIPYASNVAFAAPETKMAGEDEISPRRRIYANWLGTGIADFLGLERSKTSDFFSSGGRELRVADAASSAYVPASQPSTSVRGSKEFSSHGTKSIWGDVIERRNAGQWERKTLRERYQEGEKESVVAQAAAQSAMRSTTNSESSAIPTSKMSPIEEVSEESESVMVRGRKPQSYEEDRLSPRQTSLEDLSKTGRCSSRSSRFVEGLENEEMMDKNYITNLLGNAKEEKKRGVMQSMRARMSRLKLHVWKVLSGTKEKMEVRRKEGM